jgi:MFS family permease
MGIGRFAFTPVLPMMELAVAAGGWLAAANYVGYLVGALTAGALHAGPQALIRAGLAIVGVTTVAMGALESFTAWIVLRFAAGVASAWVLVNVSSLATTRPEVVFSGVGVGIAAAGLACLALVLAHASADEAWLALGALAAVGTALLWRVPVSGAAAAPSSAPSRVVRSNALLVACYGAFGFGYIVPATFLPAMAKSLVGGGPAFGLVWPVFGLAAAASTLAAGRLRGRFGDRNVWAASHLVMAIGVAVLLLPGAPGLALAVSALFVGGTFMVATMTGIQEARRIAAAGARPLIAAMTSAFAAGQIAGPLVVAFLDDTAASLAAAALLLAASAYILRRIP